MLVAIFFVIVLIAIPWGCALQGGAITPEGSTIVNKVPVIKQSITDFAGVLSRTDKEYLKSLCTQLEKRTSAELVVVVVKHMSDDGVSDNKSLYPTVESYANELFNKNKFGKRGKDNGILFLVSTGERKTRIEVGYGLEGILPDGKCGRMLDENAVPYFKENNYVTGIRKTTEAIVKTLCTDLVTVDDEEKFKEEVKKNIEIKEKKKVADMNSLYDTKNLIPGAIIAIFVPLYIVIILLFVLTMIGIVLVSVGFFNANQSFGYWYSFLYIILLCALALQLRFHGGGSSGSGGGGGSSGGGGASRGF